MRLYNLCLFNNFSFSFTLQIRGLCGSSHASSVASNKIPANSSFDPLLRFVEKKTKVENREYEDFRRFNPENLIERKKKEKEKEEQKDTRNFQEKITQRGIPVYRLF